MIYRKDEDVLITIGRMLFFDKMSTGRHPKYLYLGDKEHRELRGIIAYGAPQKDVVPFDTLMGMDVVYVKRESYIGLGE